jgi:hypothetical protein
MALQTLNIDDRNYDQLLEELKQYIPVSKWTDHHPSDPGIMLLELFAWLGDMTLYRMNRVPRTHKEKFLKLIMDPPEPVTVTVELGFELSDTRSDELDIPRGTRFATDFKDGERYVFETFQKTVIPAPAESEIPTGTIEVSTRCWKQVMEEEVGKSDGTANQTFPLKYAPVLLDFVYSSTEYKPNPVVYVDGEEWLLKQFLLTEDSGEDSKHFMVDVFDNVIRFGNGAFGQIPPADAVVKCSYQVIQGPEALIKAGELKHILDDITGLEPGETISIIGNHDAEGGYYFVKKEERFAKGLENYREPFRLITSRDFEYALLNDFNDLQQLTRENPFNRLPDNVRKYDIKTLSELEDFEALAVDYFADLPGSLYKIFRASALVNRKFTAPSTLVERTGHVTILVIPEFNEADLEGKDYIDMPDALKDKILRFLDKRRLITTQLHIMPAKLKEIKIKIDVVIFKERNSGEMRRTIAQRITGFMDILTGGFDQKGWPTGRNLYKSHLYRLVEDIDGVDYVKSLTIGAPGDNYVEIAENELPVIFIKEGDINVERA